MPRVGDLDIQQDIDFERREWSLQRIGWCMMALILVAALIGLLGNGPLSGASAASTDGKLRVEYNRFLHYHTAETIKVHVDPTLADQGAVRPWVDQAFADAHDIRRIMPIPVAVETVGSRQVFVFRVSGKETATITFYLEPESRGSIRASFGVGEKYEVEISQFVYP